MSSTIYLKAPKGLNVHPRPLIDQIREADLIARQYETAVEQAAADEAAAQALDDLERVADVRDRVAQRDVGLRPATCAS